MKKAIYTKPAVMVVKLTGNMSLMGASTEKPVIPEELHDDITVGGDQSLSRHRRSVWEDEEEEEDF